LHAKLSRVRGRRDLPVPEVYANNWGTPSKPFLEELPVRTKSGFQELHPEDLRWTCPPGDVPFATTSDCPYCDEIIGQDGALKAIQTGLDINSLGYNIFISGMVGTGRTTTIKRLLEKLEKSVKTPDDILYVNNFKVPDEPLLLTLPPGRGKLFAKATDRLVEMLRSNIPALLKSKYYSEKRDRIVERQQKKQKDRLQAFEEEAAGLGFSVIQVQMGLFTRPDLIPVLDGTPVPFAKLDGLVKEKKLDKKTVDGLRAGYEKLTSKLETVFEFLKETDEETRNLLRDWDVESNTPIIKGGVDEIRASFVSPRIDDYLGQVEENLVRSIELFKNQKKEDAEKEPGDPFLEYRVNLLVDNSEQKGAPVVIETNPNYMNLFGSIESVLTRPYGIGQTDFTRIKAGSFLKANGGYLVLNALDALVEPGVWATLKRTLRNQIFEIQNFAAMFLFATSRLKPEPIPCNVKVVMIGDAYIYNLLYSADEDFKKIFKIKAEFDSEMTRTERTSADYARFIKKICDDDKLIPFDREGIAGVIEYGTRVAGRQKKVSTRFHVIADVIREASYWAGKEGRTTVGRDDVEKAVQERFARVSLIERRIQEMIEEGSLMIDTEGAVVGQVNGLSVYDMGQFMFGKPTRITARTAMGRAEVVNIEREADLSGSTHNKGVLILGGFLRGRYAQEKPFALSASLAFEQSYGGVDGDSASSSEVYAILSSLARVPLRQDLAVTGSLNQKGEIQPIGGVNEKIEGFFDVCRFRGLTGTQCVRIPRRNVADLMLRRDVVDAVAEGKFHVYPVATIDEGIEILTGIESGAARADGTFEEGTLNALVDAELRRLAQGWKAFQGRPDRES